MLRSKVRSRRTNTVYHLYMESKKYNKLVNITKKEADSQMLPVAEWRGNLGGEGIKRHKLLGIK